MIRTLVFDLGGVIMNHDIPLCISKFRRILGPNIAALGLQPNGEAADLDDQESRRLQVAISNAVDTSNLMRDFELGFLSADQFAAAVLAIARPGTADSDVFDAWNAMHAGIPDYRLRLLRRWHAHHPQYALSNNNEAHWLDIHRHYPDFDTLFDGCFASHLVHIAKPDPRIFALADSRIAADFAARGECYRRSETIFVDDLEANREAARRFGWQACASVEELLSLLGEEDASNA